MISIPLITMALIMGFTGSLHCAGMCGPIIWIMPFQFMKGMRKVLSIFLYHFGRVSVYALMALTVYSFKGIFNPRVQQYVSLVLGVMLLVVGLLSFLPNSAVKINLPWTSFIKKYIGRFIANPSPSGLFVAGVLNGLLPCGLVYMALSAAVVASNLQNAILAMYAFGFGTMPMLVSITLLKSKATFLHLNRFKKLVPVVMFAFGSLFVLRGMNLGIPYLSPHVEVTQQNTVESSCCHKK